MREKLLEMANWNFGMEAGSWKLQLPETVVGQADQAAIGVKGSGKEVGLWQLRLGGMMVACGGIIRG